MWGKVFVSNFLNVLGRGMVRWLEILGENPSFSRDHGIYAWRYLQRDAAFDRSRKEETGLFHDDAVTGADDTVRVPSRDIREAGRASLMLVSLPPRAPRSTTPITHH